MYRKKIVSVNFYDIFPLTNGGQLSVLGLCLGLSEYFDVTLAMFCGADVYKDQIQVSDNLIIYPIDRPRDLVRSEAAFAREMGLPHTSPITADTMWPYNDYMVSRLRKVTEDADIILIDHPYTYAIAKAASPDKIFWHRANNVELDYMRSAYGQYDKCQELLHYVREIEEKCCQGSDFVFTVTEADREKLCKIYNLPKGKVANISVGSDIENTEFVLPSVRKENEKKILYLSGNYPAACDAAERLVEAASKLPSYQFYVAGLVCSANAFKSNDLPSNIHLLWVVSENEKFDLLKTCHLAVNPVLSGAGINMKLIEYFAFGIPVLTTTHGARGIEVSDGVELILEKDGILANDIKNYFEKSLAERDLISTKAREMVERTWQWESVAKKMIEITNTGGALKVPQKKRPFAAEKIHEITNKPVFMWGAGEQGVFCLNEIKKRGVKTIRVVDSNPSKIGSKFEGIVVEAPQSMYALADVYCVISVGALTDAIEIYRTCVENGMINHNLVIARGPLFNPDYIDEDKLNGGGINGHHTGNTTCC